jgi:uncharacterized damage-inducible protein DinB
MDFRDWFPMLWRERHRALEACRDLSPEAWRRQHGFAAGSLQRLFAHMVECERGWITEDILREPYERESEADIERLYADPASSRVRSDAVAVTTRRALETYVPGRLLEIRTGLDRDNKKADFTVELILLHLLTHELRHHGQAQAMLRLLGRPAAPNLDWI